MGRQFLTLQKPVPAWQVDGYKGGWYTVTMKQADKASSKWVMPQVVPQVPPQGMLLYMVIVCIVGGTARKINNK